jgi:hypothetical protein
VAASVFGVFGVFHKDASSIGVPVLLALSAFFGYLAVSGQRLRSLKMGEYEAAFDQLAQTLTHKVLENPAVPADAKGDVAEALGEVCAPLPTSTRRAVSEVIFTQQSWSQYEQAVQDELRRLFPDEYAGWISMIDGSRAIMLRRNQMPGGARTLAVLPRWVMGSRVGIEDMDTLVRELYGPDRILQVSDGPISDQATRLLSHLPPEPDKASFVQWRGSEDNDALVEAIGRLLSPQS